MWWAEKRCPPYTTGGVPRQSARLHTQVPTRRRHSGRDARIQSQGCESSATPDTSKERAKLESNHPWQWIPASMPE